MSKPTSVRLEPGQQERIKRLAALTVRSEAGLIRYALELGLRQIEQQQPNPSPAEEV